MGWQLGQRERGRGTSLWGAAVSELPEAGGAKDLNRDIPGGARARAAAAQSTLFETKGVVSALSSGGRGPVGWRGESNPREGGAQGGPSAAGTELQDP